MMRSSPLESSKAMTELEQLKNDLEHIELVREYRQLTANQCGEPLFNGLIQPTRSECVLTGRSWLLCGWPIGHSGKHSWEEED